MDAKSETGQRAEKGASAIERKALKVLLENGMLRDASATIASALKQAYVKARVSDGGVRRN